MCGAAGGFDGKRQQGEQEYKERSAAAVAINTGRAAAAAIHAGRVASVVMNAGRAAVAMNTRRGRW